MFGVLQVFDGEVPWQLGALTKLKTVYIQHYCLQGSLPPFLISSSKSLGDLSIRSAVTYGVYVSPTGQSCGLSGSLPSAWTTVTTPMTGLDLAYNRLGGKLPPNLSKWHALYNLYLQGNLFEGEVSK